MDSKGSYVYLFVYTLPFCKEKLNTCDCLYENLCLKVLHRSQFFITVYHFYFLSLAVQLATSAATTIPLQIFVAALLRGPRA